jgi:ADP-ribosyl-[dinitrogen reductase] hydrolase
MTARYAMTEQARHDSTRDRAIGAFVGLAVGDAIGTTLEFSRRDSRPPLIDMVGGGPFRLQAGQWTDDTSMALCLADSLLACGALDQRDLMQRFIRWWRYGENSCTGDCFDIGGTTRDALARFEDNGDPIAGSVDPHAAGNGSLMRLAPISIFFWADPVAAENAARRQSATTHGARAAMDACGYFSTLLIEAIRGAGKKDALRRRSLGLNSEISAIATGSWERKERDQIGSSGYVVHTLEAALWAVAQAEDFKSAVLLAANLGDDADTVAAVTGQLAGAIWGVASIPKPWRDRLAWSEHIEGLAASLFERGMA